MGICKVLRRIISKAILNTISLDIQQAAGSIQLCAGQPTGIKAATHAMLSLYKEDSMKPFYWWMLASYGYLENTDQRNHPLVEGGCWMHQPEMYL